MKIGFRSRVSHTSLDSAYHMSDVLKSMVRTEKERKANSYACVGCTLVITQRDHQSHAVKNGNLGRHTSQFFYSYKIFLSKNLGMLDARTPFRNAGIVFLNDFFINVENYLICSVAYAMYPLQRSKSAPPSARVQYNTQTICHPSFQN